MKKSDSKTKENKDQDKDMKTQPNETGPFHIEGHIKIFDPESGQIYINKRNAIHYENMSVALADSFANTGKGHIYQMVFGNGGTLVDPTGVITYLTPNSVGINSTLYNETFKKVVDSRSSLNTDPTRNKVEIKHLTGRTYTDIVISCLLNYGEPSGQEAFDNGTNTGDYVFDELGLRSYDPDATDFEGKLLTHVMFHPVQKSLNRLIQIDYTVRIQSLSGYNG